MGALACAVVYRSKAERLWIWDEAARNWHQPAFEAVSGGGRGQKVGRFGAFGERETTGRIANLGGLHEWPGATTDAIHFGTIPNGIFRIGHQRHDSHLGHCMPLDPIEGAMMGRGGFYIHGQGRIGSKGCIVPTGGHLGAVLQRIGRLQLRGPVYLRVEGSVTMDIPDCLPHVV